MTFGSLFAGIGGMDLGLERAGMICKWQVEIDPYARRVLEKHWPDVRRWDDVRTFPPAEGEWGVDLIAGGFPCQDISFAGKGAGLAGERSGLWFEFARVIGVLGPRYVLIENVAALLVRGLDQVLGTLASLGYDAEWHCLPAASVGAPHQRDRVFLVAHPAKNRDPQLGFAHQGAHGSWQEGTEFADVLRGIHISSHLPHSESLGFRTRRPGGIAPLLQDRDAPKRLIEFRCTTGHSQWGSDPADDPESGVGRMADGVPHRMDRLGGLGNAVVPQVAEFIGRLILEHASR